MIVFFGWVNYLCKYMMLDCVLIGLGRIASHYVSGLREARVLRCRAVCDANPQSLSRAVYSDLRFYEDYRQMLLDVQPDCAVIATPPSTHFQIVEFCLAHNVRPIIEKPLSDNLETTLNLLEQAERLDVVFHWITGCEVQWLLSHRPVGRVRSIETVILDPYADAHGCIEPRYRNKCGTWLDSGVNALSLVSQFVDIAHVSDFSRSDVCDTVSGAPYRSLCRFLSGGCSVDIDIRWDTAVNSKKTVIRTDTSEYVLDHSAQRVLRDGVVVLEDCSVPRLARHYHNYFADYPTTRVAPQTIRLVHQLLFR